MTTMIMTMMIMMTKATQPQDMALQQAGTENKSIDRTTETNPTTETDTTMLTRTRFPKTKIPQVIPAVWALQTWETMLTTTKKSHQTILSSREKPTLLLHRFLTPLEEAMVPISTLTIQVFQLHLPFQVQSSISMTTGRPTQEQLQLSVIRPQQTEPSRQLSASIRITSMLLMQIEFPMKRRQLKAIWQLMTIIRLQKNLKNSIRPLNRTTRLLTRRQTKWAIRLTLNTSSMRKPRLLEMHITTLRSTNRVKLQIRVIKHKIAN